MRTFKILLVFLTAFAITAGAYGCAKKQVKTEGGQIQPVQPSEKPSAEAPAEKPSEERKVTEAPPGPKEQPQPAEAPTAEKTLNDVFYAFDSYELTSEDQKTLQDDANWMKANPNTIVTVEGHCDERGTVEYNLALGEKRAQVAKNYLVSLGIKADRLKTISYGKSKPFDPGHDEAAWAKNRRAHFVVH